MRGAVGFTHEHSLHRLTRRLWSWRDEFGTESHLSYALGREVMAAGGNATLLSLHEEKEARNE